jgi:SseB protein N-terminal domain/SseB protein C-terminal domain
MSLRGSNLRCFILREDAEPPGPPAVEAQQAKTSSTAAEQPDFANSPLPAAMFAVAKDDSPQNRQTLYQSMFDAWFIVPTREAPPEEPGFHNTPTNIADSLSLEHNSAGQLVAVAFTDEEALRNWNKNIPWIALQGTAFFQAMASTEVEEIVINPYDPGNPESKMIRPGGIVRRWEFEELAGGKIPEKGSTEEAGQPQSVLVTMPKQMPAPEVFDGMGATAAKFADIAAMYFAQVTYPDGEPHWTIAVEFATGTSVKQVKHAMAALVKTGRDVFPKSVTANLVLASAALGQSIKTTGKKFYSTPK